MTSFFKNGYRRVKQTWDYFIDYIFPRGALEVRVHSLTAADVEKLPKAAPLKNTCIFPLFDYKDSLVKEIIWQIKFYENETVAQLLAKPLSVFIQEICPPGEYIVLPMPISKDRLRERGFNQTELIAQHILPYLPDKPFTYRPDLLQKTKETKHQTGESRKERLINLKNSFSISDAAIVKNKKIVLIDDVTTTGATFTEAAQTLKNAGATEVFCIGLAH